MNILVVTSQHVVSCREGRYTQLREVQACSQNVLGCVEKYTPDAVLFSGIPDPLELASAMRKHREFRELPIAVLGQESEQSQKRTRDLNAVTQFLQRAEGSGEIESNEIGNPRRLLIDRRARLISIGKQDFACSPLEFRLFLLFLYYPDILFSRQEITRLLRREKAPVDSRIVDVLVRRLRQKIEFCAQRPLHLQTAYGLGYVFKSEGDTFVDVETRTPFERWVYPFLCNILFITSLLLCDSHSLASEAIQGLIS